MMWLNARAAGRNYDIHDFPINDMDGSPLIMEIGFDITDRKHAEVALIDANEMKLLGQLTSGVAHKVRNLPSRENFPS